MTDQMKERHTCPYTRRPADHLGSVFILLLHFCQPAVKSGLGGPANHLTDVVGAEFASAARLRRKRSCGTNTVKLQE